MGHNIEYFAEVSEPAVREWLERLEGHHCSNPGEVPAGWEGRFPSGEGFWAQMCDKSSKFTLAMKYSWLWSGWSTAVEFSRRFEAEFWKQFGPIPLLRVDEFLVSEWLRSEGGEWERFEQPVERFVAWAAVHDEYQDHWHLVTPDGAESVIDVVRRMLKRRDEHGPTLGEDLTIRQLRDEGRRF